MAMPLLDFEPMMVTKFTMRLSALDSTVAAIDTGPMTMTKSITKMAGPRIVAF